MNLTLDIIERKVKKIRGIIIRLVYLFYDKNASIIGAQYLPFF